MTVYSYKGRMVVAPTTVFAYRNLHKDLWSLKAMTGVHKGKVIGHADEVSLFGCELKVSDAGRERVLATGRKNVHAGIIGLMMGEDFDPERWVDGLPQGVGHRKLKVSYNPYKAWRFNVAGEPINVADVVHLADDGKAYIYGTCN